MLGYDDRNAVGVRAARFGSGLVVLFADIMMSAHKSVFLLAFMNASVPCFCAPRGTALRQQVKESAHPTTLDTSLGEYERKTQSPMIWINLHKTDLSSAESNSGVSQERK